MRELVIVMAKVVLILAKDKGTKWRRIYENAMKQADVKGIPLESLKHYAKQVVTYAPKINEMQKLVTELENHLVDAEKDVEMRR